MSYTNPIGDTISDLVCDGLPLGQAIVAAVERATRKQAIEYAESLGIEVGRWSRQDIARAIAKDSR